MIWRNLTLMLRVLIGKRIYTLINLFGLSVGLAGSFILMLYVFNESMYDRFNENYNDIYRINTESKLYNTIYGRTPYILGDQLMMDMPDGILMSRTFSLSGCSIWLNNQLIPEERVMSADSSIFDILTFDVLGGDKSSFLRDPESVVITRSISEKYFGDKYPVGKVLRFENGGESYDLKVSGLIEDFPQNSTFKPSILVSNSLALRLMDNMITSSSNEPLGPEYFSQSWSTYLFFNTYILAPEGYSVSSVETLLEKYENDYYTSPDEVVFKLQPLKDIYLGSGDIRAGGDVGDRRSILIYSIVALVLLLTASLNFILLSTAIMNGRRKEIGLKMINGAGRFSIIRQLLLENIAFSLVSMLIGLTMAEIAVPRLSNVLFGKEILIDYLGNPGFSLALLLSSLLIGTFSGLYLAFKVSSGKPYEVLKSSKPGAGGRPVFTRILNSLQLLISVTLLICTGTIYKQLNYFNRADIGFNIEGVISIDIRDNALRSSMDAIKDQLRSLPGVESVSGSMWSPPTQSNMTMGLNRVDNPEEMVNVEGLMVDYDFVKTLGLRLMEGRDFSPEMGTEAGNIIINHEAISALGIKGSPLGVRLSFGTIIGVVEDFHIHSFHSTVPPMIIQFMPQGVRTMLVRIKPNDQNASIENIRNVWRSFSPDKQMEYRFLTEALNDLYSNERRLARILVIFSGLTLIIALLGIFGMASLNTERRRREVGIRKVMGAESKEILWNFVLNYTIMALVSSLLAFPLAYMLMQRWLSNFQYHGKMGAGVFIFAALMTLVIVLATVAWQVKRAASTNPLDSIRYE